MLSYAHLAPTKHLASCRVKQLVMNKMEFNAKG